MGRQSKRVLLAAFIGQTYEAQCERRFDRTLLPGIHVQVLTHSDREHVPANSRIDDRDAVSQGELGAVTQPTTHKLAKASSPVSHSAAKEIPEAESRSFSKEDAAAPGI